MSIPSQSRISQAPAGSVLVVGGGRFGQLAARRLGGMVRAVVEPEPSPALTDLGLPIVRQEGTLAVAQALEGQHPPRWIVPCLPRHLLADWLRLSLAHMYPVPIPLPQGLPPLPQVMAGPEQTWYLSLTDTLCPDDCPEPADACPKTGQPRGLPLFTRLGRLRLEDMNLGILRSHQLAPGVGGLASREMLHLRGRMAATGGPWLVATACRCHGVAQALELARPEGDRRNG